MSNSEIPVYNIKSLDASSLFVGSDVSKSMIAPTYHTSCEITFHDNKNNKNFHFTPKEDITAFELAHVFRLFMCMSSFNTVDVGAYVEENVIERHFTET